MPNSPYLKRFSSLLGLLTLLPAFSQTIAQKPAVLTIQVDKSLHSVSPMLYGLMTEEINFSYDGGLYPEMVKNRTLRDPDLESAGLAGCPERGSRRDKWRKTRPPAPPKRSTTASSSP